MISYKPLRKCNIHYQMNLKQKLDAHPVKRHGNSKNVNHIFRCEFHQNKLLFAYKGKEDMIIPIFN